jgi:Repeat of unknown function (DUF5650)
MMHVCVDLSMFIRGMLTGSLMAVAVALPGHAAQVTINGPVGSGEFGKTVTVLPNGNFVVADPGFGLPGPISNVGAVYLYRSNGVLISRLNGSVANSAVGSGAVTILANGNFVVVSPNWDTPSTNNVGAVTWVDGNIGLNGAVSTTNSLVGTLVSDQIGSNGVTALPNGHYVVLSANWDNGAAANAGAATWGNGTTGIQGEVTSTNSMVGTNSGDSVGAANNAITVLSNGNVVLSVLAWDNGTANAAGAVTWINGTTGRTGPISAANSLVGTSSGDEVGKVTALSNGNYVVCSPGWDNGTATVAGAVTWGSGDSGIAGPVSTLNSLVGTQTQDLVCESGIIALSNGNYVVRSAFWANGPIAHSGAATWGNGVTGTVGAVSSSNSLVGATAGDLIGKSGIALSNGNYVVGSASWVNGVTPDAGAMAWGNGSVGSSGLVSATNALVGTTTGDRVGACPTVALSSGNYVVCSREWNNGVANSGVGAVTWGNGNTGSSGLVSTSNSLVGSTAGDLVGTNIIALSNGNYVVGSPQWDDGSTGNVGAVTWGNGASGVSGPVSSGNSLIGTQSIDMVGNGLSALRNGNYVVTSPSWDNGSAINAGAATWADGSTGLVGPVTIANSLFGTTIDSKVGAFGALALSNGNYLVASPEWDNGALLNAGAATWGNGNLGVTGPVSAGNSLVGTLGGDNVPQFSFALIAPDNGSYIMFNRFWDNGASADAGAISLGLPNGSTVGAITTDNSVLGAVANQANSQSFDYDDDRNQLVVGQPLSNRTVQDSPDPSIDNQLTTLTATVTSSTAPSAGRVRFIASSGESCVDTAPTVTGAGSADFSCTILFVSNGVRTIYAEYSGSLSHAFNGSGLETHTANTVLLFGNGFE